MHRFAGILSLPLLIVLICLFNPAAVFSDTTQTDSAQLPDSTINEIRPDSAQSEAAQQDSTGADGKSKSTKIDDIKSFWELTKLGGGIRWAIFLVFAIGIALIIEKAINLFLENRRSKVLLNESLNSLTIEKMKNLLKRSPRNLISELFSTLLDIFQATGQASDFHEEIANYIKFQQDRFNTFKGRLTFLSDTAGALGLLGTVWGMFQTFFGGNLDKQLILNGMGIALITTLLGLVVSIILNFFATEIFSRFNKQLEKLQSKADEFRIRFLEMEQDIQRRLEAERNMAEFEATGSTKQLSKARVIGPPPQKKLGPPHKLVYISGDGQAGIVNKQLPNPLVVELLDVYHNRLPNQVIRFKIESDQGYLSNGGKVEEIATDSQGRALTHLTLGTRVGENIVKASTNGLNGRFIEFKAVATADAPASLDLISGNNQSATAGKTLPNPFVVGVRDSNNNPIPNYQIHFKITMGNGSFAGGNSRLSLVTDNKGVAEAYFTLGKKPGFNRVLVTTKKLRRAKLEFQVLGQ
ncbi:MotA/TolQ/ExbB proton channel family protein [candidate division KSB1 bacterium]|nr:MotA/TolQ/ExbB proton channel family protein [candidate division KSB1 bacterium]